jgi:hypothetical protein
MEAVSSGEAARGAAMASLVRGILERIGSEHGPLVRSLRKTEKVLSGFSVGPKAPANGRPPKHYRNLLMLLLSDFFRSDLEGHPVNHAVAGLVTATFPEEKPLTEPGVRERGARRKEGKYIPGRTFLTQR